MRISTKILTFLPVALIGLSFLLPKDDDRTALENKRQKLLTDIETSNKILTETSKNKSKSLAHLQALQGKISKRNQLIENLSTETRSLENDIRSKQGLINSLQTDLEQLRQNYASMIRAAYKHQLAFNEFAFIFSADDFNKAFKRMRYLQEYARYRKQQARLIEKTMQSFEKRLTELEADMVAKQALRESYLAQIVEINEEKEEKNQLVAVLQTKERSLKNEIRKKRKNADELQKSIEEIIRREIELARLKAKDKKGTGLAVTPESAQLSAGFSSNKGKLPWPVERGIITSSFGEHPHPVLKSVKTKNNGVDIRTEENAIVRALFEGSVVSVMYNPGFQTAILVKHGDYFSLYSNLKEAYVTKGDKVTTKQTLGLAYTEKSDNKTEVHLEIWKNTSQLNPALWIYR